MGSRSFRSKLKVFLIFFCSYLDPSVFSIVLLMLSDQKHPTDQTSETPVSLWTISDGRQMVVQTSLGFFCFFFWTVASAVDFKTCLVVLGQEKNANHWGGEYPKRTPHCREMEGDLERIPNWAFRTLFSAWSQRVFIIGWERSVRLFRFVHFSRFCRSCLRIVKRRKICTQNEKILETKTASRVGLLMTKLQKKKLAPIQEFVMRYYQERWRGDACSEVKFQRPWKNYFSNLALIINNRLRARTPLFKVISIRFLNLKLPSQKQTSCVASSVVGEAKFDSVTSEFSGVSHGDNFITNNFWSDNLGDDLSVRDSDHHSVFWSTVLIFILVY